MKKPILLILSVMILITVVLVKYSKAQQPETHDYVIIEATTALELSTTVKSYLNKGYTPAGGFMMERGKLLQALFK